MSSPTEPGVLIIAGSYNGQGGLQRQLSMLAASLVRDRSVTVLTWGTWARPRRELREDAIQLVVVPSVLDWGSEHGSLAAAVNTAVSVITGASAAVLLRRRWSVAFAAGLQPEAVVAALAARGRRRFVVRTWLVGPRGNVERLRRSITRRVVLRLLRRARWFVAETSDAAQELIGLGLPTDRVTIVAETVDVRRFRPRERLDYTAGANQAGAFRAVYTGRFDLRQKRLDLLLDAWRAAALSGWELVLAGSGPDEGAVRRRAEELASVRVLGWQEDVAPLLASSDVFLLPTEAETTALSMLEGMACGLPGIVSATAGLCARSPDGVMLVANRLSDWVNALQAVDALGPTGRQAVGLLGRDWVKAQHDPVHSNAAMAALLS
jgi:glycosyltransferase involved in cell wall biosynthesis